MDGALETVTGLIEKLARDGCVELDGVPGRGMGPEVCDAAPQPEAWREPVMEEIVFAACDCSAGPRGTMKISLCTGTSPKNTQS